jgi:glycyl-tRNA synthetase
VVLKIPAKIAPTKLAILPLLKKDGLPEIAKDLMNECKGSFMCFYEEKDAIGKRYRRMDAIGTPFCITIDHQTKEDNTVTIRYRDDHETGKDLPGRCKIYCAESYIINNINTTNSPACLKRQGFLFYTLQIDDNDSKL